MVEAPAREIVMNDHATAEDRLRCRRGSRCTDARTSTATLPDGSTIRVRTPAWATIPNGLCRMDTTLTHQAIRKLAADHLELSDLLGKTSRPLGTYASSSRDLAVPIRLNVEALQAAIVAEIDVWAAPVAAHSGFVYRTTGRGEHHVRYGSGWIIGRWPLLLQLPVTAVGRIDGRDERLSGKNPIVVTHEDGVDGALRLLWLHEQVTEIAGRTHRAERLWSPCPQCQRVALERQEGSGHVDCARCGHRMPLAEYEKRASVLAMAYEDEVAVA
jgi:Zn ribbon nucleic-acid-binding protein